MTTMLVYTRDVFMQVHHRLIVLLGLFHLCKSICTSSCLTCPCFATRSQTISLSEDAVIGSTVFTFVAMDPYNLALSYSISSIPPPNDFRIDSVTGELIVAQELDYETTESYTFGVEVENTNGRDTINVIIELSNIDDNPTMCAGSVAVISVTEEQLITDIQLPDCTDDDVPSSPSFDYSIITGNETGLFTINNGNISLLRPLDYEVQTCHDLLVSVVQSGGSLNFNMTILVEVVPVNEHTPMFSSSTIHLTVSESALVSSSVGQITATDEDAGNDGSVNYSILSQTSNKFAIHPYTGEVVVARSLDYETAQLYSLTVVARDSPTEGGSSRSSTVQVQISVQDTNDNRPYFSSYVYYSRVSEQSSVGYEVTHMQCNDSDSGLYQEMIYSIVAGNEEGKFQINSTSGQVALVHALDYDNNNTQFYNLTVECQEVEPPRGKEQTLLLIGVESFNEFRPDPGANYIATVSEDSPPGTSILRVVGRDRDSGLAGKLTYTINYNIPYCPENIIYIDQVTGVIYLNAPLDYESGLTTIYCTVLAQDSEEPLLSNTADLQITVTNANDVAPECDPPILNTSIPEDSPVGSAVVTLSHACSDADSTVLSYSILEAPIPFHISSGGVLTVNDSLDFEASTFHRIPIEVSDGELSFNATVFVNILGVNEFAPVFTQATYSCSVNENDPIGSLVCTVSASDDDSGLEGTVYYQISTSTQSNSFVIDRESGKIYTAESIDYEREHSFSLTVEAHDLGEPSLTASVSVIISVIDLNDNHPNTDSIHFFEVSETAALGETVSTLNCTDADAGINGQVNFHLNSIAKVDSNGTITLLTSDPFTLEPVTGAIIVNTNLDYESDQLYRLSIVCRDSGTPSCTTFSTAVISLRPENEHTPTFSQSVYSVDVSENATAGSSILMVSAFDDDAGVQGDIFYSLQLTTNSLPFAISLRSGVVTLIASLDCLQDLTYMLTVIARDEGNPPLQSEANIDVNVLNCHLGDLVPQQSVYIGSVDENSPSGTAVLTVACYGTRISLPSSYSPQYRLSGSDSGIFQIDEDSGLVSVSSPPDFEASNSHLLTLQCFDGNHPETNATAILALISTNPANEHAPAFTEDAYSFSIKESTPLGSIVFSIEASDSDSGKDGEVTYSISGNDSSNFFIDPHSGEVYLSEPLDRETQHELMLTVSACDNPENITSQKMAVSTISIQVTDSNDNWPQCSRTVYHLIVSPQTEPGSIILSDLGCSDVDLGLNGELEYTLGGGSESADPFAIERNEGRLTLIETLDLLSYHIPITIQDRGSPSFSITVLVVIDVQVPSHTSDMSIIDGDHNSLSQTEGLNNAVTITLHDISIDLWDTTDAPVDFQDVVAGSVTKYCAILPEACSLVTGCSQFYGTRNRRSIENNFANFHQGNIVVISNDTKEIPSLANNGEGTLSLEIRFYVILPSNAERDPYRETNYVIPRATLSEIVSRDGDVIEAVVRDSLSPPLTPVAVHLQLVDWWKVVGIGFSVLFSVVILALVLTAMRKAVIAVKQMKDNRVIPIKNSTKEKTVANSGQVSKQSPSQLFAPSNRCNMQKAVRKATTTSFISDGSSGRKSDQLQCNSTGPTCHQVGRSRVGCHEASTTQFTDSSSTLSQISFDHDRASMDNNASSRGRRSTGSDLDSSMPSNHSESRGSRDRPASEDYLDNFPYAPPNRKPIPRHIVTSRWSAESK